MGLISQLLNDSTTDSENHGRDTERFSKENYGVASPVPIYEQELAEIEKLLDIEQNTPDGYDSDFFLDREDVEEMFNEMAGVEIPSLDEQRQKVRDTVSAWGNQHDGDIDSVWGTGDLEINFRLHIKSLESRINQEHDELEAVSELDTLRDVRARMKRALDDDAKLAVVHKKHLPLQSPSNQHS